MLSSSRTSGSHSHHRRRRRKVTDDDKSSSRKGREKEAETRTTDGTAKRTDTKGAKTRSRAERTKSTSDLSSPKTKSPTKRRSPSASHRPDTLRASSQSKPKVETPKKGSGFLHILFGGSKSPPEKKITCLTCLSDDIPISKSARLACTHRMCYACLKRVFIMSISDPQHMPPRCCTSEHIPLKHVDKLFDSKFKKNWNRKYQEYMTGNRIYCPARGCGEWIKPSNIHVDLSSGATGGRKYGKCSSCKTKVCVICNGKFHRTRDCPKDADTQRLMETAKEKGWQRCYNCSAMVELKEGCNHITCRCTAEFCIICGAKWKSCGCAWFNYNFANNMDADVLQEMNIPEARMMEFRRQAEAEARRQQQTIDEEIARRMEGGLDLIDHDRDHHARNDFNANDFMTNNPYMIDDFVPLDEQLNNNPSHSPSPLGPRPRRNRPQSPIQEDTVPDDIAYSIGPGPTPTTLPKSKPGSTLPQRRQSVWSTFFNPAAAAHHRRQTQRSTRIDKWMREVDEER